MRNFIFLFNAYQTCLEWWVRQLDQEENIEGILEIPVCLFHGTHCGDIVNLVSYVSVVMFEGL